MLSNRSVVLSLAAVVVFLGLIYPIRGGLDLWGHLYYGLETLQSGSVVATNTYSFTAPEHPWTNHEWLFEVLLAMAYRTFGASGPVLVLFGWMSLLFLLLRNIIVRTEMHEGEYGTQTLLVAMFVFLPIFARGVMIRPQLATYVLTLAFLDILQHACDSNRPTGRMWLLPVLMVAWVNLHGGFLVGLALMGIYPLYLMLRPRVEENIVSVNRSLLSRAVLVGGLTLLVTLVNPYGLRIWGWLYHSLREPRPEVDEWQSVLVHASQPLVIAFLLTFMALMVLVAIRPRRYFNFLWVAFLCMGLMAFRHVRHIPLALLAGIPAALRPMDDLLSRYYDVEVSNLAAKHKRTLAANLLSSILVVIALGFALRTGSHWFLHGPYRIRVDGNRMPVAAAQFLKDNKISGNVATEYDWGQYLIWHNYPAIRVSIDGRYRTAYPRQVLIDSYRFQFRQPGWERMLTDYPSTLILVREFLDGERIRIGDSEWVKVYEDGVAVLLAKDSTENFRLLEAHAAGDLLLPAAVSWRTYFP